MVCCCVYFASAAGNLVGNLLLLLGPSVVHRKHAYTYDDSTRRRDPYRTRDRPFHEFPLSDRNRGSLSLVLPCPASRTASPPTSLRWQKSRRVHRAANGRPELLRELVACL